MNKKILFILIISFVFLGSFLFVSNTESIIYMPGLGSDTVDECPSWTDDQKVRDEYKCFKAGGNYCGANVQRREYRRTRGCDCTGCGEWSFYHTTPVDLPSLESWQECHNSWRNIWVHHNSPQYSCQGHCLENINNLRFNGRTSQNNVSRPARITWDNVDGFGHVDKGPPYYFINIEDTNADPFDGIFSFKHFYETDEINFPRHISIPRFSAYIGAPGDGQFILEDGKFRFARPTPHLINNITSCYGQRWGSFHAGIDIGRRSADGNHPVYTCVGGYGSKYGFENVCLEFTSPNAPPIFASAPGIIESRRYAGSAGNMVIINHSMHTFAGLSSSGTPRSIKTRYLHLQNFSEGIQSGDEIISVLNPITGELNGQIWGIRKVGVDIEGNDIFRRIQIRNDAKIGYMGSTGSSTGPHLHFDIIINGTRVDPLPYIAAPGGWRPSNLSCVKALSPTTASLFDVIITYANYQPGPDNLLYVLTSNRPYDGFHEGFNEPFSSVTPFTWKPIGNTFLARIPVNNFTAGNCLLKPDQQHKGWVRACCDYEGNNCGSKREFNIKTNNNPEILKTGVGEGTEKDPEIVYKLEDANLRWCEKRFRENFDNRVIEHTPDRYEIEVFQKLPLLGLTFWQTFQCHPLLRKENCIIRRSSIGPTFPPQTYVLNQEHLLFTKSNYAHYRWKVRACLGEECTDFSKERFLTVSDDVIVSAPNLVFPKNDPDGLTPVGWPIDFRWDPTVGANSYTFEIFKENNNTPSLRRIIKFSDQPAGEQVRVFALTLPRSDLNFNFEIDTLYRWRVRSCWDEAGTKCEKEWSEGKFRTTGRPPKLISPSPGESNVLIPLTLKWEDVPGANSYIFSLFGEEDIVIRDNEITLDHKKLIQNEVYHWSVRTCNHIDGLEESCGPSSDGSFTTIKLIAPQNLSPETEYLTGRHNEAIIKWDKVLGANFYRLRVNCEGYEKITPSTQVNVPLNCIGDNSWTVEACIDPECNDRSEISSGSFTLTEGQRRGGLIPCGLRFNNPDTDKFGINESEPCQPRHLFVLLKRLIDLILWELTPLALFMLVLWSAVVFYTSMGNINTISQIKSAWKAVGKGLVIMFFSWLLISFIVSLLGFRFGIYGQWFQI